MMQPRYTARSARGVVQRDWIPSDKVPAFLTLLEKIAAYVGSHHQACVYCGVPDASIKHINDGKYKMTSEVAQRILAGYKKMKAEKAK